MADTLLLSYYPSDDSDYYSAVEGANTKVAQSFTVGGSNIDTNRVVIRTRDRTGNNSTVTVRIETDSASSPSGTLVHANATSTISSTASNALANRTFNLAATVTLTASTKYWIVMSVGDADDRHDWIATAVPGYASQTLKTYAPSSWTERTGYDGWFEIWFIDATTTTSTSTSTSTSSSTTSTTTSTSSTSTSTSSSSTTSNTTSSTSTSTSSSSSTSTSTSTSTTTGPYERINLMSGSIYKESTKGDIYDRS